METNRYFSDEIRLHTEDPAEGDDPWPGPGIRAHSQDSVEGPDDITAGPATKPAAKPAPRLRPQEFQPETD